MNCTQTNRMRHVMGKWGWVRSNREGEKGLQRRGQSRTVVQTYRGGTVSGVWGLKHWGLHQRSLPVWDSHSTPPRGHIPKVSGGKKVCQNQRLASAENASSSWWHWQGQARAERCICASRCTSLPPEVSTHVAIQHPGLVDVGPKPVLSHRANNFKWMPLLTNWFPNQIYDCFCSNQIIWSNKVS